MHQHRFHYLTPTPPLEFPRLVAAPSAVELDSTAGPAEGQSRGHQNGRGPARESVRSPEAVCLRQHGPRADWGEGL